MFDYGHESLITSKELDLIFGLNPEVENRDKSRDSLRVRVVPLSQADGTLERKHKFIVFEEVWDGLGVEARVLPVFLNDSLNENADIELTLQVVLV